VPFPTIPDPPAVCAKKGTAPLEGKGFGLLPREIANVQLTSCFRQQGGYNAGVKADGDGQGGCPGQQFLKNPPTISSLERFSLQRGRRGFRGGYPLPWTKGTGRRGSVPGIFKEA
jgi:hypothetical protein